VLHLASLQKQRTRERELNLFEGIGFTTKKSKKQEKHQLPESHVGYRYLLCIWFGGGEMAVRKGKSLRATTKERREAHDQLLLQFET
jgi:hypothetical protein